MPSTPRLTPHGPSIPSAHGPALSAIGSSAAALNGSSSAGSGPSLEDLDPDGEFTPPTPVGEDQGDAAVIAELMRADPALVVRVAASVDSRTAAAWALTFSRAATSSGSVEVVNRASAIRVVPEPTTAQLRKLLIRTSIPFIGFGFFDNMIMLTVGETIDCTFGVAFGFSTLAAAGLGQMVSDASGITLQGVIERFADRLGLPDPKLSLAQQHLNSVKYWMILARVVGIVVGCFIGMFPLIMMPERQPRLVDQIAETLSMQSRTEFQRMVTTQNFKKGEKLVAYGAPTRNVFMIQEGSVEVIGRDNDGLPFSVCTIGPGHAFGRPELKRPSHVDLVAKDDEVVVQSIPKDDFTRIIEDNEGGMEIFRGATSSEHEVYLRSQGQSVAGLHPRAVKNTGKTRFFAASTQEEKLEVLQCVGTPEALRFTGRAGEGKVSFFATLTEEQKRDALAMFLARRGIKYPKKDA